MKDDALKIDPQMKIFEISCKTHEGLDEWVEWYNDSGRECLLKDRALQIDLISAQNLLEVSA